MAGKSTKKLTGILIAAAIVVAGFFGIYQQTQKADQVANIVNGDFSFHMIDIGIGDSFLIQSGGMNMLVDAGENDAGDEVVAYLKKMKVEKLDFVIGTHAHSDHIGGLDYVIDNMPVDKIIMSEIASESIPTNKTYTDLLTSISKKNLKITKAKVGDIYNIGEAQVTILGPVKIYEELNNTSVVARVDFGETSIMLTGDMESDAEKDLIAQTDKNKLQCDLLKVGHHGSKTSTSSSFLKAIKPDIAAISVNKDNKYGHPNSDVMSRLESNHVTTYLSRDCGSVVFLSDGKSFEINCENKQHQHNKVNSGNDNSTSKAA